MSKEHNFILALVGILAVVAVSGMTIFASRAGVTGTSVVRGDDVISTNTAGLFTKWLKGVSGEISLLPSSVLEYGGWAEFSVILTGNLGPNARTYITTICSQDGHIVYQASNWTDYRFSLVDLAGQGLEWNGAAAECSAALIMNEVKGKNITITKLDQVSFSVTGSQQ